MSGAVYICSREKTHHAGARLDLQHKTRDQLDHWKCEVLAPEGAPHPHPLRVPTRDTFSRLRRVDGASQTANLTDPAPRWGLAFRVRPGKSRFDHI